MNLFINNSNSNNNKFNSNHFRCLPQCHLILLKSNRIYSNSQNKLLFNNNNNKLTNVII